MENKTWGKLEQENVLETKCVDGENNSQRKKNNNKITLVSMGNKPEL